MTPRHTVAMLGLVGLVGLAATGATAAVAQQVPQGHTTAIMGGSSRITPPEDHRGQWWTHPSGCQYSRAGRPGEVVWYLIINTARPECPTYIATRGRQDIY